MIYRRFAGVSVLLWVAVAVVTPGSVAAQDGPSVEITRIADNIHKVVCSTRFTSNCLVVTGADGLLLVDSGMPTLLC